MGTKDVRVDPKLNQQVWVQGIKNPPTRIRVKFERKLPNRVYSLPLNNFGLLPLGKRNDDDDAKEKLYTYASYVQVASFKVGSFCTSSSSCLYP